MKHTRITLEAITDRFIASNLSTDAFGAEFGEAEALADAVEQCKAITGHPWVAWLMHRENVLRFGHLYCHRHYSQEFDKLPSILREQASYWTLVEPVECEMYQGRLPDDNL